MKKIDWRFALAVISIALAVVATLFVDRSGDQQNILSSSATDASNSGSSDQFLTESIDMPAVSGDARTSSSWFCPGVPGTDKSVTSELIVANASEIPITGKVTFLSSDKQASSASMVIQPFSRRVLDATGGRKSKFISAIVELDNGNVAVEQRIIHPAGDTVALCANKPSDRWFFADGFTGADSDFKILLTNPFPDATVVDISFITQEGKRQPASLKGLIVEAESVYALSMGDQGAQNETVLGVIVRASSGRLVAGKLQHFLGRGRLGYTSALGASAASRQWWFAGGQKDLDTEEQFVFLNPTDSDKSVSVSFLTGVGEELFREPLVLTIPAGRVVSLETSSLPAITDGRYGVFVSSITDDFVTSNEYDATEFVVVEQLVTRKVDKKTGTTVTFGAPNSAPGKIWTVASGFQTTSDSLIVANTTSLDATLTISSIGPAGVVAIDGYEKVQLGAAAVVEIKIPATSFQLQLLVESDTDVVVQREISRGHDLVGISSVLAIPYRVNTLATPGQK